MGSSQNISGTVYTFSYGYNVDGTLNRETYPSGRVVNTCYDGAGRVSQVSLSACGNTSSAYATNILYAAQGAPTQYVFGNTLWHKPAYNSRLQMSGFSDLINNNSNVTLLSATLDWGSTANNGNLMKATWNNGGPGYSQALTFIQTLTYDGVNRLTGATDTGGWSRTMSYDAYGNMTPSGNPAPPTESFNGNNQIVGQSYDQIGNLLSANGNTLAYDFDNRLQYETDGVSHAVETYSYDGEGHRIQKTVSSGGPTVNFVYDAFGRLAAEYSTATQRPNCITCYLTQDHLGSTRLVTDQNGAVAGRHDFLPFGEEVGASQFGRDAHWGSGNDFLNQKFTGKERDAESGLDYFGARYYGSGLGRFTSPDDGSDQYAEDPQSWNLYNYTRNNPLSNVDRNGRTCSKTTDSQGRTVITDTDGQGCAQLHDNTVNANVPYEIGEQAFVGFVNLFFNGKASGAKDLAMGLWESYPLNLPFTVLGHSEATLAAAIRTFKGKTAQDLIALAQTNAKGGQLTEAGRALQKHSNRAGSAFSGTSGSPSSWNEAGEQVLNRILQDPGATVTDTQSRSLGQVVDITDSTGKGARFSKDMSKFIGFIEP